MNRRAYRQMQHVVLGGLCLALALPLLSVRLGEPPPARALAGMDTGNNPATTATDLVLPQTVPATGLEHYAEITARPLFSRSRRPADATAITATPVHTATATTAPDFQLTAVIIAGKRRIALLRPLPGTPPDAEPQHVVLGERYRGWRLTKIRSHAISVKRNGQEHTLELDRTFSTPERAPSRPDGLQAVPPAAPAALPVPAEEAADLTQGTGE